ncbi:MAG: ATP-binding cassette domain-containing protein [Bacteroidales bacterium]|nr:ATP-binding cassette domain-containing protein [Bacteroidales bacterium]
MSSIIHIDKLRKTYNKGTTVALDDISLDIEEGEFFGIVGPDGAGKTSLYRLLTTLLVPDSGTATVDGNDIVRDYKRIRNNIGYMPGKFSLYQDLSIEENLKFFATTFGTTIEENYHLIEDIYKQIEPFKKRPSGKLSGGMKQKLALSCALIHAPRVLFLDEPTTGVDPVSRRELFAMLKKLNTEYGITIVVSSPYRDEVMTCSRIAILNKGKITAIGRPQDVLEDEIPIIHDSSELHDEYVIEADGLTKQFGSFIATDHITFKVRKGEIFGFLGANGAGKTTAMRMLCGLSQPTDGSARVAGYDCATEYEQIKKHIGYMSQKFALYEDLTVEENMNLYGGIYGMDKEAIRNKTEELLKELKAEDIRKSMVSSLPLGWKQKLAFSISIFHNPGIVFLDEPTGGVDSETRRQFWELIYKAADRGVTIFVTTHYMDEAEYCDRVSIMVDGKIRALDTPDELKKQFGADTMYDVFLHLARQATRS